MQNFTKKQKCLNLGQKSLIHVFWGSKLKLILSYLKSVPSNIASCKISWKNKNAYIFHQKCLILLILGNKFRKPIVIFEISILNFVYLQNFAKKTKIFILETKIAWFGYFWTGIWKQYCNIWDHHPQICQTAKFLWKTKMPQFATNNAFFWYLRPKMPYLGIFGLEF